MKRYDLVIVDAWDSETGQSEGWEAEWKWVRYEDAEKLKRERDEAVQLVCDYELICHDCGPTCTFCPLCRKARAFLASLEESGEG